MKDVPTNMADPQIFSSDFFLGIMTLKAGKWSPHSKFDGGAFGTALMKAEDLDKLPDFEAVKIMRLPKAGKEGQKEMWISPRLRARSEVKAASQLKAGVKQTKEKLAAERKSFANK